MSMKTVITIEAVQAPPSRRWITIPVSDRVTQGWWERQVDPSTSVRMLILDEAQTHGLVDRMGRIGMPAASAPQPAAPAPVAPVTPPAQTAAPAATAAAGHPTLLTDPREVELELMREELRVLRQEAGAPPLFRIH